MATPRPHKGSLPCFAGPSRKAGRRRGKMATKTALVLLASGAEEMEAVIAIDVLRRAKVTSSSVYLMKVIYNYIIENESESPSS